MKEVESSIMIKYSAHPNQYNSVQCAISAVLPVFHSEGWKTVVVDMSRLLEKIWSAIPYGDADICKKLRKAMLADITEIIFCRTPHTAIMREWNQSLDNSNVTGAAKLQLLFSLADAPKFPIYKESDLHKMADNISQYVGEINAITYFDKDGKRICPYHPSDYHNDRDLKGTIQAQKGNIVQFLIDNAADGEERQFYMTTAQSSIDNVVYQLEKIAQDYEDFEQDIYKPSVLELEFFRAISFIRKRIQKCESKMRNYKEGTATAEQFSLSESKSPISNNDHVMRIIHALGWNKSSCPAVLSNIFYSRSLQEIGILKQEGQIEVDEELYFEPAPGLGPGYKVRWVYSVDTNVNNYLTPLADLIQKADKICDPNEAYNDQLSHLLTYLPIVKDAFCTDSTGYSDYLWVGIYRYLMHLYGMSEDMIDSVMACFRLPVKIAGKFVNVEFGTFQGCKLLVFIMNHANRLMGIIADRLSNQQDCIRPNAGDDVVKAALDHEFSAEDMWAEILTFACFNCPTNSGKSAWLSRDGYFDFCSKYFSRVGTSIQCVSGVPAKKYGKEVVCIADWAESYKVLHNSKQQYTDCSAAFRDALPFIRTGLEQGCKLPNIYNIPMTVDSKIEQALEIPFTYGGLASCDDDRDLDKLINTLKYKASLLLNSYMYEPSGVYLLVSRLKDLEGTELLKAIGSINHQSVQDLVKLVRMLASPESMSMEDLEWAKESVAKFERNSINGQSLSRTSSTYHRLERNKDVDLLFPLGSIDADIGMPLPKDNASALLMVSLLTDRNFVDIDNMRRYIACMQTIAAHPGTLIRYYGIGNDTYYGIKDPDNGKIVRIYNNDDTRYPNFEPIWCCKNAEIRSLAQMLRDCGAASYVNIFYDVSKHVSGYVVDEMASKLIKQRNVQLSKAALKALLKQSLSNIVDRMEL